MDPPTHTHGVLSLALGSRDRVPIAEAQSSARCVMPQSGQQMCDELRGSDVTADSQPAYPQHSAPPALSSVSAPPGTLQAAIANK